MAEQLSGPLLGAFIDGVVRHSKTLQYCSFNRKAIAIRVFGKNRHAEAYLSKCCSPSSDRYLTASRLEDILDACRTLLTEQQRRLGVVDPTACVTDIEREVSQALGLPVGRKAEVADFSLEERFETATSAKEFGVPDLAAFPASSLEFLDDLRATQSHGLSVMQLLVPRISRTSDVNRRLDLLQVVLSIASLHHPGSRRFHEAHNQALIAAGNAQLFALTAGNRISDGVRSRATGLLIHLFALPFTPTLDSPANALRYAFMRTRLDDRTWRSFQSSVKQAVLATEQLVSIDPSNEHSHRIRAAYLSQHARLLAATAGSGSLREADQLEKQSLRHGERLSYPYGHLYPIQTDILRSRLKPAIQKCEQAIDAFEAASNSSSAAAFAALQLQLTRMHGGDPTADSRIRELARAAVTSPSIRYQCSHVFDAESVCKLLPSVRSAKSKSARRAKRS